VAEKKEETDEAKDVKTGDEKPTSERSNMDLIEPPSNRRYFRMLGVKII